MLWLFVAHGGIGEYYWGDAVFSCGLWQVVVYSVDHMVDSTMLLCCIHTYICFEQNHVLTLNGIVKKHGVVLVCIS